MGLFRFLVRAFFPRQTSSGKVRTSTRPVRDVPRQDFAPATPPQPRTQTSTRIVVRQSIAIKIVDVLEVRGSAWVVDGDTIDIKGVRIRLAGIDAPEMDHPYGKTAKWTLISLCKGQEVRAIFHGSLSHDRNVATCYLSDGRDLSAEMVKAGMAVDWRKFSHGKYAGLEVAGIRKKLWRCDARQKGRLPAGLPG